jgi:hypothetical protein
MLCRLKKHRRFNGHAVQHQRRHPDWGECGWLSGGFTALVVRYSQTSYITNRLALTAVEVRRLYRVCSPIEEVIRVCKDQRGLTDGQARSEWVPRHHLVCCLVASCVLEREQYDRPLSISKLKRPLSFTGRFHALPSLEQLRRAT